MKDRKDYIADCMDDTGVEVSIDKFMDAFCSRCLNSECKRSALNDLKWQQRMDRQLQALNHPEFADPNDPDFKLLADQNFVSFEKEKVTVDSWDHFEGVDKKPSHFKKEKKKSEPVIHKAEAPTQHHEGQKVDQSVSQLAASRGKELPAETPVVEEPVVEEPVVEEPVVEEPVVEKTPQGPRKDRKPVAPSDKRRYNTDMPEGGILLSDEGRPPVKKAPKKDTWAIPDKGNKTLVVRADTGEVVDQKDT